MKDVQNNLKCFVNISNFSCYSPLNSKINCSHIIDSNNNDDKTIIISLKTTRIILKLMLEQLIFCTNIFMFS